MNDTHSLILYDKQIMGMNIISFTPYMYTMIRVWNLIYNILMTGSPVNIKRKLFGLKLCIYIVNLLID